MFAQGKNVRDWLYVEDHCRAIDDVLTYGHAGEIFNIGGFNEEQNIDVVRRIINSVRSLVKSDKRYRELSALPPEKIDYSLIEFVKDRPGHDMRYAIENSNHTIVDPLHSIRDWHTENREVVHGQHLLGQSRDRRHRRLPVTTHSRTRL